MATRIMQETIQDALDDLSSSHASTSRKGRALDSLEKLLAEICGPLNSDSYPQQYFIALQDTFQCNIPSRLLVWISESTFRLEALTGKGSQEADRESETQTLSSQLVQSLNIIQGIALQHASSKQFLSRRYGQDTLLDLLLVSRHVAPIPLKNSTNITPSVEELLTPKKTKETTINLTASVLDTLLCVLVDSPSSLRTFEEASGLQYVVRILKRSGTPREVRMKCLEFIYFYLMDETTTPSALSIAVPKDIDLIPTAPNSPVKPSSRSTTHSSISSGRSSSSSSFSTDSGYGSSFSMTSFNGTSTPKDQSPAGTSKSTSPFPSIKPSSRGLTPPTPVKPRSLGMLKKDVDYTPISPRKAQVSKLGLGVPRVPSKQREVFSSEENTDPDDSMRTPSSQSPDKSYQSPFNMLSPEKPKISGSNRPGHRRGQSSVDVAETPVPIRPPLPSTSRPLGTRTMEEKKEILGGMLGNVDALVEGVRKAGVWGLG
ncbi:hypothetical protein EIP91_010061 [Steccherinum ochraceum]|uniref:Cell division control protein 14 n=1 Tax=Steccherinum ochraceum TaxID=92696 RepID=A0A4R0RD99_9APHY|nr:hypothetical protein EIP91_010061 [Steccherinum ochraceum]